MIKPPSLSDAAGLVGVAVILAAYAGAQLRRLDPVKAPSLILNLIGAGLILVSLVDAFNLAAFLMEAAWMLVAALGLIRVVLTRR